jgi:hypothetical protein
MPRMPEPENVSCKLTEHLSLWKHLSVETKVLVWLGEFWELVCVDIDIRDLRMADPENMISQTCSAKSTSIAF